MSNLQLEKTTAGSVGVSQNIIFDSTLYTDGNISYDNVTGEFSFAQAGVYKIEWWVATQSSSASDGAVFGLVLNGDLIADAASPQKTGQVNGFALINIPQGPFPASLTNQSNREYFFPGNIPVKAGLIITKLTIGEGLAVIPYYSRDAGVNFIYGSPEYGIYSSGFYEGSTNYAENFPDGVLEEYEQIVSFSMPSDGVITNITGSVTFSGEVNTGDVSVHACIFASPPDQNNFTYIAASDVIFDPPYNQTSPIPSIATVSADINIPLLQGYKVALFLYMQNTVPGDENTGGGLYGIFSGSISLRMF